MLKVVTGTVEPALGALDGSEVVMKAMKVLKCMLKSFSGSDSLQYMDITSLNACGVDGQPFKSLTFRASKDTCPGL